MKSTTIHAKILSRWVAAGRWLILLGLAATLALGAERPVQALDQRVQGLMTRWRLPGASIAVVREGKLVHARGYGLANVADRVEAKAQTQFRIASVSKPLTAVAILRLLERGAIELDRPVFGYLEEWKPFLGDPRMEAITIRHLLQHRGGWDSDKNGDPCFPEYSDLLALGASFPPSREELLAYVLQQPLEFAPGSREAYSNFGYVLLGRVIERVTGLPYEEAVRELVFAPFGAGAAHIGQSVPAAGDENPAAGMEEEARYYDHPKATLGLSIFHADPVPAPRVYGGFSLDLIDAAGGWVSSAPELAKVFSSLLGDRDPLLAPPVARLLASQAPGETGKPGWYGLGVNVVETPFGEIWGHAGRLEGSVAWWVRLPDNTNLVFLANSAPALARTDEFLADLEQSLLTGLLEVVEWPEEDLWVEYLPQGPRLSGDAVRNLADRSAAIAPGALVRIAGSGLGPVRRLAFDGSRPSAPNELGGVSVTIGGRPAPLLSVGSLSIEAIVPQGLPVNASVPITVRAGGQESPPQLTLLRETAPALFRSNGSQDAAAVLNSDGSKNTPANPAAPGSVISLFLTGAGATMPALEDGAIATAPGGTPLAELRVLVEDMPAAVLYAGAAPGLVQGVTQVNALLPGAGTAADGMWKVEVEVGGRRSAPAFLFVGAKP